MFAGGVPEGTATQDEKPPSPGAPSAAQAARGVREASPGPRKAPIQEFAQETSMSSEHAVSRTVLGSGCRCVQAPHTSPWACLMGRPGRRHLMGVGLLGYFE